MRGISGVGAVPEAQRGTRSKFRGCQDSVGGSKVRLDSQDAIEMGCHRHICE